MKNWLWENPYEFSLYAALQKFSECYETSVLCLPYRVPESLEFVQQVPSVPLRRGLDRACIDADNGDLFMEKHIHEVAAKNETGKNKKVCNH